MGSLYRMRVNSASSQVGLSQLGPGQLGPVMCFFLYKNVQQKFERIMFGSIYYAGLSILFHSTGLTL